MMQPDDMKSLIRLELWLEEIMSQIKNGNQMGDDYVWHTTRIALMECRTLIDRLYEKAKNIKGEA